MMQKLHWQVSFVSAGFSLLCQVQAQTIYRCGSAYSQIRCPGASPMEFNDARLPEQKLQTEAAALNDARLANTMERERLAEEERLLAGNRPSPQIAASAPVKAQSKARAKTSGKKIKRPKSKAKKLVATSAATLATHQRMFRRK